MDRNEFFDDPERETIEYQEWYYENSQIVFNLFSRLGSFLDEEGYISNNFILTLMSNCQFLENDIKDFIYDELGLTSYYEIAAFIKGMNFQKKLFKNLKGGF